MASQSANVFLQTLPESDYARLAPHLKRTPLEHGHTLFHAGDPVPRLYFPVSGIISLVIEMEDGNRVEAGMIGRDGVVGASGALDGSIALNQAIVQSPGEALTVEIGLAREVLSVSLPIRSALYRHDQLLLLQAQQSAACNARHQIESRLCRWLLRAQDLVSSDDMPLTQEFLAQMLGVQRPTISIAAHHLQASGLIKYRRGHVSIVDLDGVKESSCECYEALKAQEARLFGRKPN
jgi:CRP-like cAMP-binding protein